MLAFALAAAHAVALPPAYPAAEVLRAFASVCGDLRKMDTALAAARNDGWSQYAPPADERGAKAELEREGFRKVETSSFRRTVAGRPLRLVIFRTPGAGDEIGKGVHCELTDVTAHEPIPMTLLTAMIGHGPQTFSLTPPTQLLPKGDGAAFYPGLGPGTEETRASVDDFIDPGFNIWSINKSGW